MNFEQRVKDAGGSVVEALHGHKCGPDCWHRVKFDVKFDPKKAAQADGRTLAGDLLKMAARAIRKKL